MEDRRIPRHDEKTPCAVCGGLRYVKRRINDHETETKPCPACVPPGSSEK